MTAADSHRDPEARRRAPTHPHRSVWVRLFLLLAVLAAIFLLPRIADLFTPVR